MNAKRFVSGDALVLLALLVILAILSLRFAAQGQQQNNNQPEMGWPRRTITSTKPGGWKAAFLLLRQRGVNVKRWEKSPKEWPANARVIIAGQEYLSFGFGGSGTPALWDAAQAQDALTWVEKGGTLVVLTGNDNALTEKLGLEIGKGMHDDASLAPRQPVPYLKEIKGILSPGEERFTKTEADAGVLFGDDKPAVVTLKRGTGRIIVACTAALIDNTNLASQDNARLLVQLVHAHAPKGELVLFDEFHQGYHEDVSFWNAIGKSGQLAFYQILVVLGLLCYSAGVRFGLARPLPQAARVSSEYVMSLANLYRRAKASDAALEGVYLSFWRDLCRAVGMPLDSDTQEVSRAAASALGDQSGANAAGRRKDLQGRLAELLLLCEERIEQGPKAIKDNELLRLAREIEEMRKELGLGRDDRDA